MRVYVPASLLLLKDLHEAGELRPAPAVTAFAVTPQLREWCGTDDAEELEYAALGLAAEASLRLLAESEGARERRVVLAAEIPGSEVPAVPDSGPGEVRPTAPVRLTQVAAVHVDADDAGADVAAAAGAVTAADGGDEDAQARVDEAAEHELLWFATQEIPSLLA